MSEIFFEYNQRPFVFNTETFKIFQICEGRKVEVVNPQTIRNLRLRSMEISREAAFELAARG
jgi:hypothetical protein